MTSGGIPIKLLHEAEGHIITCETVNGEVYRGRLFEAEDSMNLQLKSVTVTQRDGKISQMEAVYIRGSKVRFLILPDMLQNAPMLRKSTASSASAAAAASAQQQQAPRTKSAAGAPRGSSRPVYSRFGAGGN